MIKLENMTLPSGRKLEFAHGSTGHQCRLISSKSNAILDMGDAASRLDALAALIQQCDQRMMRLYDRHHEYWYRVSTELRQLHNEARQGIPKEKPRKADPWGIIR